VIFQVPVQVLSTRVGVTAGTDTPAGVAVTDVTVIPGVTAGGVPEVPVHPAARTSAHTIPVIRIKREFFIRLPGLFLRREGKIWRFKKEIPVNV
jgi:hypothetical protein